ncbi:MAG: ABC transporter permease [Chloroflexi bacterium]|nr:ABC transporter permease [Chloroflexota bacterium]
MRFDWQEAIGLLGIYVILIVVLSILSPYFLSVNNFLNILVAVSTIGIMSVATTMVIVSGGIDLSIGSVVAIAGVIVSLNIPIPLAILVALVIGVVVGCINGFAVTRFNINPLITTLGMMSIVRGFAFVISGGLSRDIFDEGFGFLGRGYVLGIPFQVIVMVVLFLLTAWVMRQTTFGRAIYAVGGNAQAARLAGLPVRRLQMTVYILSGLSAALGGVFLASQLSAGAPAAATGIELSVIAAVILGGSSLNGGKGTIWGTLLGVLILGTLNNGLTLLNVSSYYQDVARGLVLLLAVGLDQLRLRLTKKP